jgi:hypothetical protein
MQNRYFPNRFQMHLRHIFLSGRIYPASDVSQFFQKAPVTNTIKYHQ